MSIGGPENAKQGLSDLVEAMAIIRDPKSSTERLSLAFNNLPCLAVRENPSFWIRIVNDESYRMEHRRLCLYALLERHLKPGSPVDWFSSMKGTFEWFQPETVIHAIAFQTLPVKRGRCEDVYEFEPGILKPVGGSVTLRLSHNMSPSYLLLVLRGELPGYHVKVLEWAILERGSIVRRSENCRREL